MSKKVYIKEGHVYKIKNVYSGFTKKGKPWQVGVTDTVPSFTIFFDNVGLDIRKGDEIRIDKVRQTIVELKDSAETNKINMAVTTNADVTKMENGIPQKNEEYDFKSFELDWSV